MSEPQLWELLRARLDRFAGGDVEWTEESGSDLPSFRGPIKTLSLSEAGGRLNISLVWCARATAAVATVGGGWYATQERSMLSISQHAVREVTEDRSGQLHFVAEGKHGTFYPKGQNLSPRKVRDLRLAPNLGIVR